MTMGLARVEKLLYLMMEDWIKIPPSSRKLHLPADKSWLHTP